LRCDDCVKYHLLKCRENGVTEEELFEVLGIATLVGGTIVVPHMRRAVEFWDDMQD
jgi:alkylhydroperoxidase/carboxymuconolactone decarboxylase family protein YurZ